MLHLLPTENHQKLSAFSYAFDVLRVSEAVMERFPYPYNNRIYYYDAVIEQIQSICVLLWV